MDRDNEEMNGIAYRDILLSMINGLVIMIAVIVLLVSVKKELAKADVKAPGNLIATINWPAGDTDVDLWVMGPGEPMPVGFSNMNGRVWNLLRDDLGNTADATNLNYEFATTHGIVPGTYWINAHCYRCPKLPVRVNAEISLNKGGGDPSSKSGTKTILTTSINLVRDLQEVTIVSFKMDAQGNIDPASMNNVYKPLRYALGK